MKRLILIPSLLISFICSATNYYAKTGGNDANSGLDNANAWARHPWMSTWTGTVVLVPGDAVYMNRGDTWTIAGPAAPYMTVAQSGTSGNYITTGAYGAGADPIIMISTADTYPVIYIYGKSYLKFDNLDIRQNSSTFVNNSDKSGIWMGKNGTAVPHDITVTNCTFRNIPHTCVLGYDDSYNITIGDITAISTATAVAYSNHCYDFGYAGIMLKGCNPTTFESNFKIYYNYIHDATRVGIGDNEYGIAITATATSAGWPKYGWVRYNNIQNIDTWEAIETHGGSYLYFQDNYIKQFGRCGIALMAASGVGVLPCISDYIYAERNIIEQPTTGWVTGAEDEFIGQWSDEVLYPGTNIYIRDNTLFYTARPASGLFSGISTANVNGIVISGNKIYNGSTAYGEAAINFYSAYNRDNVTIKNNYIKDWGDGIFLQGPYIVGVCDISYNIIADAVTYAIRVQNNLAATSEVTLYNNIITASDRCFYNSHGMTAGGSLIAKNNIFGETSVSANYYWYWAGTISGTFECDYNIYWNASSNYFYLGGSARNWAYWTATAGYDANSPNTAESLDPQFKNGGGSYDLDTDFDIPNTSPVINQGMDVGLTTDYNGSLIYGLPDIGAWEYYIPSRLFTHLSLANKRLAWSIINDALDTLFVNSFDRVDALYDSLATNRGEALNIDDYITTSSISQPTYHIQMIGTTIYAYPGLNTGYSSVYSGSELADVINSVVAVVDSGAVIQIRNGHYNLTDSILLKSYVTYDFSSKARVCVRGNGTDYEGPVFYKPVATELRSCTVQGGYFYGKSGENRGWNFCNLRSNSTDYPAVGCRFLNISMFYLKTAFELVTTGSGWLNANIFSDITCWSPTQFLRANNTSSNEISYNVFTNILIQANAWTTYGIELIGETIFNQFVNVQCIDLASPMVAISTTADVSELNYFSGSFGFGGDEISDLGDGNLIINGGEIASAFHTQGNVMHKPKNTGNVVAGTGITKAMLSRVMYYNGGSAIDITADPQIVDGEDGQIITIIGSSNTNTLKLDDDDVLGKIDLSATITLGQDDNITLIFIGSTSTWVEIERTNN